MSMVLSSLVPEPAERIVRRLAEGGSTLVALSGGVDSGVVASFAVEALGDRALAVTLVGPAVSALEAERARAVAEAIGIRHRFETVDPIANPEYRANPSDRCYFCRSVETEALLRIGGASGIRQYVDGVHRDDLGEDRPGLRAMDRAGFRHPLAEAGWGKADVRRGARTRGLPNWDAPSDACLASRVRHGQPISAELLHRVERAETLVRALGFRQVRVRVDTGAARVEVDPADVARLSSEPALSRVRAGLIDLGFASVRIDPAGYGPRSGAVRPS